MDLAVIIFAEKYLPKYRINNSFLLRIIFQFPMERNFRKYRNYIQDLLNDQEYCELWIEGTVSVNGGKAHFR